MLYIKTGIVGLHIYLDAFLIEVYTAPDRGIRLDTRSKSARHRQADVREYRQTAKQICRHTGRQSVSHLGKQAGWQPGKDRQIGKLAGR